MTPRCRGPRYGKMNNRKRWRDDDLLLPCGLVSWLPTRFTENCGGMDVTRLRTGQDESRRPYHTSPSLAFVPAPPLHALLHPYSRRPARPHIKLAIPDACLTDHSPPASSGHRHPVGSQSTQNTSPNILLQQNATPQSLALPSLLPSLAPPHNSHIEIRLPLTVLLNSRFHVRVKAHDDEGDGEGVW